MAKQLKPDLGKEWRKVREEGAVGRLPSGRLVRGRPVRPLHILELGEDVPDILTSLALKLFYGNVKGEEIFTFHATNENVEQALKVGKSLQIVTRAFLLEPHIVDEPLADDEIYIDDVTPADQAFIFDCAFMEADALSRFLQTTIEQDNDLQALPEGEAVRQTTE